MGLLRSAIRDVLRPTVKSTAGVRVRFHSWSDGNVYPLNGGTILATMAESAADAETSEGIQFTETIKDFKIDVADLPVMPQDRDVVIVEDGELGAANKYYQVLSTGGAKAVEPLGNFEDTWEIHTKAVPPPDETVQVLYGNAAGLGYGSAGGVGHASARR